MSQLIDLKVGFSCNNRCSHCVVSDKKNEKDLSFLDIKKILDNYIEDYGTISLTITGGEATIRKDFFDILDLIKEYKKNNKIVFCDLQTNGRMFKDINFLRKTSEIIDFYLISLHSNIEDIHDMITCSKGSFIDTVKGIKNFNLLNISNKIAIQTVINKNNIFHLKEFYDFIINELKVREINITFPHPIGTCFSTKIVPSYKESYTYINDALSFCIENNIKPYIEAIPFCILKNGNNRNYLLNFLNIRNIDVVGYAGSEDGTIHYKDLFNSGHSKYSSCSLCKYNNICDGIWKEHIELYPKENLFKLMVDEND